MTDAEDWAAVEQKWDESRRSGRYLHGWTIYDHPSDFPNHFVVREWRAGADLGGDAEHSPMATLFDTLEDARASLPPGVVCIPREPADDPVIIESWL